MKIQLPFSLIDTFISLKGYIFVDKSIKTVDGAINYKVKRNLAFALMAMVAR